MKSEKNDLSHAVFCVVKTIGQLLVFLIICLVHPETAVSQTRDLFLAIRDGDVNAVRRSIDRGAELEARLDAKNGGYTPLLYAVNQRQSQIVTLLLEKRANCNARDQQLGWTPLTHAIAFDSVEIVRILLKCADLKARDALGNGPLHWAVQREMKQGRIVADMLINAGADVNAKGQMGLTPLHQVAAYPNGNTLIAEALIKHGAKVDALNDGGKTPLQLASEKGNKDMVLLLRRYGAR